MWGFSTLNAAHLRIEGFNITIPDALTGWHEKFGVFVRSDFVEVRDNYFFDIKSAAINGDWGRPWPKNAYIVKNHIYRSQMGIIARGDNWIVEDNEVRRLVWWAKGDSDYARFFGDGIVFRGNVFHGTFKSEIGAAHVDCWQTFNQNGEYATNTTIESNICRDASQGMMLETVEARGATVYNVLVRNNVFADLWSWGIATKNEIGTLRVLNNVFANIRYHGVGCDVASSCEVRNNVFYNAGSNYWKRAEAILVGSNNLLFSTTRLLNAGQYPDDIVNVDPLFVDAEGHDFRLRGESRGIDAGSELAGVDRDLVGVARPQGAGWDIGAYEYHRETVQ
jgi:hypothetical protein